MKRCVLSVCVLLAGVAVAIDSAPVLAAGLTSEHRRDLGELRRELGRVPALLRQKKGEEAEKILTESEVKLKEIVKESGVKEDDKAIAGVQQLLSTQKTALVKHKIDSGEATPLSFVKDVAPILNQRCVSCHGNNNPRNRLQVHTFAGMEKGGQSGALLVIGKPEKSLLVTRLTATGAERMPKGGQPVPQKEIETITAWILQGAKFDGTSKTAQLDDLIAAGRASNKPKETAVIARATGEEKVSFTKDIAPFMVNLCVRCHSGNTPRSGFSLETFEKLMQGGDSGRVVIPGNPDGSRMWDLVGKQDPIKMPPGQALITRTNWNNLRTWIEEGAKFDGGDAKKPLRDLVPSEAEMRAAELAKLSPAELAEKHLARAHELWKMAASKEEPKVVQSDEFIVIGNVAEGRLDQVNTWAEDAAQKLRKVFGEKKDPLWKGKLTIFVIKDRFTYEEFNTVVERRGSTPREVTGHSKVTDTLEDAYVVLQDVGDGSTSQSPGLSLNLMDHMTGAYLQRGGSKLPNWVLRGTGLAVAAQTEPNNEYIKGLRSEVPGLLKTLDKPEDVFNDGTFSPSSVGPVGYTLVDFLLKAGGGPRFGQFVKSVQGGTAVNAALKTTYATDAGPLAQQYGNSVSSGGKKK